jgi:signal transduction histidine kinase
VKLPALVIGAVLLTAATAGVLVGYIGYRALERQTFGEMREAVKVYQSAVGFFLANARSHLEGTAVLPGLVDPRVWQAPREVPPGTLPGPRWHAARILRYAESFEYLMLVGADGVIVALEPAALERDLFRRDVARAAWFGQVRDARQAVLSDLHISPATRRPTVVAAVPVRDAGGRMIGVWAGGLRLEALSRTGVSRGELHQFAYLTDGHGLVVAHQASPTYVQYQTDFSAMEPVRRGLAGGEGVVRFVHPIEGDERLTAYQPIPGTRWVAVAGLPVREAFAPLRTAVRWSLYAVLAVAAVMGLLGLLVAARITGPLRQLTGAVRALGTGEMGHRLPVRSADEVGQLAEAFNRATAALQEKDLEVRRRAAELEAANRELEGFTYTVSHDLRAPLRAVHGYSRILLEDHLEELSGEARRYLELAGQNVRKMGQLIDDMLAFSRVGRHALQVQEVQTAEVVAEVIEELRAGGAAGNVELVIGPLPTCLADPRFLRQVFSNLLVNALKFSRHRAAPRVEVGWERRTEEDVFFVRDNGIGFDMRYVDKLFGVFQRLHRQEEYEGTGVGLAIVQRIVARHGGRVWAEGVPDRGATFFFTLTGGERNGERR